MRTCDGNMLHITMHITLLCRCINNVLFSIRHQVFYIYLQQEKNAIRRAIIICMDFTNTFCKNRGENNLLMQFLQIIRKTNRPPVAKIKENL